MPQNLSKSHVTLGISHTLNLKEQIWSDSCHTESWNHRGVHGALVEDIPNPFEGNDQVHRLPWLTNLPLSTQYYIPIVIILIVPFPAVLAGWIFGFQYCCGCVLATPSCSMWERVAAWMLTMALEIQKSWVCLLFIMLNYCVALGRSLIFLPHLASPHVKCRFQFLPITKA